jgi:hypothetical protein
MTGGIFSSTTLVFSPQLLLYEGFLAASKLGDNTLDVEVGDAACAGQTTPWEQPYAIIPLG